MESGALESRQKVKMEHGEYVDRSPEEVRKPKITSDMYLQLSAIAEDIASHAHFAFGRLLDIGAGKAPYKVFFDPFVKEYVKFDSASTLACPQDVVGDAQKLPFANNSFDTVFSSQTLEHIPYPQKVIDEIHRVLKPGGVCILTTHMANPLHGMPHDYFRFTKQAFRYVLFKDFKTLTIKENGGALLSIAQFVVWGFSFSLPKLLSVPIITCINVLAKNLDKKFFNDIFTTNYIVVAQKKR
ncbi:MAG: class I SAM-dependent methyltransferase [Nanoarchaeota archaeon]|nr:class I SAM-dependent methyltransferase [Nanoarchaeota archaeon]